MIRHVRLVATISFCVSLCLLLLNSSMRGSIRDFSNSNMLGARYMDLAASDTTIKPDKTVTAAATVALTPTIAATKTSKTTATTSTTTTSAAKTTAITTATSRITTPTTTTSTTTTSATKVTEKAFSREIPNDLLLYKHDQTSIDFLHKLYKNGTLLELTKKVAPNATSLQHWYPNITLDDYHFKYLNGTELPTKKFLRDQLQQSVSRDQIPSIVHFYAMSARGSHYSPSFSSYLSYLSALWISGADLVVVWCNKEPRGYYWNKFVQNVTLSGQQSRLLLASRPWLHEIFGNNLAFVHHEVDVMKLETAILIGGIFLDSDSLTLKSLKPLFHKDFVIGREAPYALSIGAFLSKPNSKFVLIWYMAYQCYFKKQWSAFSVFLPAHIHQKFPSLCEPDDTMTRPNAFPDEIKLVYNDFSTLKKPYDWSKNYMVHIWQTTLPGARQDEKSIRTAHSLYGEVARFILFGDKRLRPL